MIAPVLLSVVAMIAGHPTTIVCDNSLGGYANGSAVAATPYGGNVIYATVSLCDQTAAARGSYEFALALSRFIHEAAHARGVRVEGCAELIADLGVYQVLRDFYGIPFFTTESRRLGDQVLEQVTRRLPAAYQPDACWSGVIG